MKTALRTKVLADTALMALVPAARWVERGSLVEQLALPFCVLAASGASATANGFRTEQAEFYVYDERGSYENINAIIRRLIIVLNGAVQMTGTRDYVLSVEYNRTSPDMEDDGYRANVRSVTFQVTVRSL